MMGVLRRHRADVPDDPVADVIQRGDEYIVTEPISLMRELVISGRGRDQAWLQSFIVYAAARVGFQFEDADIHLISCCWALDANRMHMHVTR